MTSPASMTKRRRTGLRASGGKGRMLRLESLAGNYTPRLGHSEKSSGQHDSFYTPLRSIQTRDLAQLKSAFSVKSGNIEYLKSI